MSPWMRTESLGAAVPHQDGEASALSAGVACMSPMAAVCRAGGVNVSPPVLRERPAAGNRFMRRAFPQVVIGGGSSAVHVGGRLRF
jgi:hypothetical protein